MQGGQLCLWAKVAPGVANQNHIIEIVGTGHPMAKTNLAREFIATVIDGALVWHIFELRVA